MVFPNFHGLKIVRTAFVAVRNGICDRGLSNTVSGVGAAVQSLLSVNPVIIFCRLNLLNIILHFTEEKQICHTCAWATISNVIKSQYG